MSNYRLDWQSLLPNTTPYRPVFSTAAQQATLSFAQYQPRLADSLTHFCHPYAPSPFMLLNAEITIESFTLIHQAVCELLPPLTASSPVCNTENQRLPLVPNASLPLILLPLIPRSLLTGVKVKSYLVLSEASINGSFLNLA